MKIVIASGIYPPDVGGPAQYAYHIAEELRKEGHIVEVLAYGTEKKLPTGIRHVYYFLRMLGALVGVDAIFAFDSYSVGFPALLAAKIWRKKILIRLGGDFLWESYVERTGDLVALKDFYVHTEVLNIKERIIEYVTRSTLRNADAVVFNTPWFRDITVKEYELGFGKTHVVENYIAQKSNSLPPIQKNFIFATRDVKLKNGALLKKAFEVAKQTAPDIILDTEKLPHEAFMQKIASSYAVILPSITDVSPNLVYEAIRFNKPFICTKESGIYEELKDIGIFVDPFDARDITEKIVWLADPNNYADSVAKIKTYTRVHTWKEITEKFVAISKNI